MTLAFDVVRPHPPQLSGPLGEVFGGTTMGPSVGFNIPGGNTVVQIYEGVTGTTGPAIVAAPNAPVGDSMQASTGALSAFATVSFQNTGIFTVGNSEPLIPGTEISIFRISALRDGGTSVSEIMEDFPSLTRAQIEYAEQIAQAFPLMLNAYPKRTLKHFLRKGTFRRLKKELAEIGA